jgi:glycine betaine/proline transport system ATP-binding protein
MQDLLLELQAKLNKTIVFITHDLDEALRLADSLAILKDGFVVQAGDPQDIVMHPADEYIENFVRDINRARVVRARAVMQPVGDADVLGVQVAADDNLETVLNALHGDVKGCVGVVHEGETIGMINVPTLLDVLQSPQR